MDNKFTVLQRNKRWVAGATIAESCEDMNGESIRRFTATIRGYQNWKIYEGPMFPDLPETIIGIVREIRDKIDEGDEAVFSRTNEYLDQDSIQVTQ